MRYFLGFIIFLIVLTLTSCGKYEARPLVQSILPPIYRCTFIYYGNRQLTWDYNVSTIEEANAAAGASSQDALSYSCYLLIE